MIVALAAHEKVSMPDFTIKDNTFRRGWASANLDLQMKEWAFEEHFAGAIIDDKTGEKLEYIDLIKRPELQERWYKSLANELGQLAQGIRDIPGTNTFFFLAKSEIPADRRREVTYGRIVDAYKP